MTSTNQSPHDYPPGSADALGLGCNCSGKRNNDGLRPPFPRGCGSNWMSSSAS